MYIHMHMDVFVFCCCYYQSIELESSVDESFTSFSCCFGGWDRNPRLFGVFFMFNLIFFIYLYYMDCCRICLQVVVVDPEAYTYDDEVIQKAEAMGKPGLVDINAKEDSFIFTVESTGAIKASQLVINAIEILRQKLGAVRLSLDTEECDEQFGELGAHLRGSAV